MKRNCIFKVMANGKEWRIDDFSEITAPLEEEDWRGPDLSAWIQSIDGIVVVDWTKIGAHNVYFSEYNLSKICFQFEKDRVKYWVVENRVETLEEVSYLSQGRSAVYETLVPELPSLFERWDEDPTFLFSMLETVAFPMVSQVMLYNGKGDLVEKNENIDPETFHKKFRSGIAYLLAVNSQMHLTTKWGTMVIRNEGKMWVIQTREVGLKQETETIQTNRRHVLERILEGVLDDPESLRKYFEPLHRLVG